MVNKDMYVLKYKGGAFVALEPSSGGYPYPVQEIDRATRFDTVTEAIDYGKHFWGESDFEKAVYTLTLSIGIRTVVHDVWTECNHHCSNTVESTAMDAKHFLDCPVWAWNKSR